jgi:glycosyltransferase involved in cell wall biosynthesis
MVRSVEMLCEGLAALGHHVEVFTTNARRGGKADVPLHCPVPRKGFWVHYFPRLWGDSFFYAPSLTEALVERGREFDLLHCSGIWTYANVACFRAARRHGVPYVISPRGVLSPWPMAQKRAKKSLYMLLSERRHLRRAAAIHCTSAAERRDVVRHGLRRPVFVVPNAVDLEEMRALPQRGKLREALGIPRDAVVLLFLSRLHKVKGLPLTLRAFARLCSSGGERPVHFIIAGPAEDGYERVVHTLVRKLKITKLVNCLGMLRGEARLQAFADADLFVLNSFHENFGIVVAEAMACGLPVLISENVDLAGTVVRNGCGMVVPQSVDEIYQALRSLVVSEDRRRQMGERGRQIAFSLFGSRTVASEMAREYERLVTGGIG